MKTQPFFARYLTRQDEKSDRLPVQTEEKAGRGTGSTTLKYPSDGDESYQTMKYPSDGDEGYDI